MNFFWKKQNQWKIFSETMKKLCRMDPVNGGCKIYFALLLLHIDDNTAKKKKNLFFKASDIETNRQTDSHSCPSIGD